MPASSPMERALELAAGHRTHPNPRVGAVLVKEGSVVGEGFHAGPGRAHAEVVALEAAGNSAHGSVMYVTLEPCIHHGRTPPCADAIVAAGVSRVVIGVEDPDERVRGKGIEYLRSAGVGVELWSDPERVVALDPGYFHHRRTGLPRVVAKYAMTLDGAAAAADGSSKWITGPEARADAHRLRSESDVVVVGAGTLRADNPLLDVRAEGYQGGQPRPVVIAGSSALPEDAAVWERDPLVISTRPVETPGGEVLIVEGATFPDPRAAAYALAERGYFDVLIEGGPTLLGAWWRAGLVSTGYAYIAAKIGGGAGVAPLGGVFGNISEAHGVEIVDVQSIGTDVRIEFR